MLPLLLLAVLPSPRAEEPWFYPGTGPERVVLEPGPSVAGVPVARTGAVLVRAADPLSLSQVGGVAQVELLPGPRGVARVVAREGVDEIALSRRLRARADVRWAHPDLAYPLVPHSLSEDPFVGDQWHLENTGQSGWTPGVDLDAPTAWDLTVGRGALIAILDTGVDLEHPDLSVVSGWDYLGNDDDPSPDLDYDGAPHGTAAAGLAAAVGDNGIGVAGVAHGADIHAVRLIGGMTSLGDVYDSFVDSVDAGAWVLSNSWGFNDDCTDVPHYSSLEEAVLYAETEGRGGLGTAVVASAGNGGCDISGDGFQALPEVVSVAAINGYDERESYSSYGDHVDVAAPSGGLLTTDISGEDGYGSWEDDDDYYGYFSGTSASAPLVAGTLALMFSVNERLTAAQARQVLCETATRSAVDDAGYDSDGWSPYYGCGRVDAGAAVLAVANDPPSAPVPTGPQGEVREDRVLLGWDPATDPDGDWLEYRITWSLEDDSGGEESAGTEAWTTATWLDLTGEVQAGDTVTWQVVAVDPWGDGELPAESERFSVAASPVDGTAGCGHLPDPKGNRWEWLLPGLALVLGIGRRGRKRAATRWAWGCSDRPA